MTRWTRRALRHVDEIKVYYTQEADEDVARRMLGHIQDALTRLDDYPSLGRIGRIDGTRELVVPRTPYIVAYRVRRHTVEVLAVLHAARRWPTQL